MASKLTTWVDETLEFFGQPFRVRLKVPPYGGSSDLVKHLRRIMVSDGDPDIMFDAEKAELVAGIFKRWVRLPEPVEIDEETVTDGTGLLAVAPAPLIFLILAKLGKLIFLTEQEGKASASPSTPSAGTGSATAGSSSPAPSTASEAGPAS